MVRKSRRVVITGLGVVAPNGIGKDAFWDALIAGKSGIDYITAFDASSYPCQIAGEVKGFIPTDFISAKQARVMARFSQLAVASTRLALEDASLSITPALAAKTTVCFGNSSTGLGDVATEGFEALSKEGVAGVKPWTVLEFPPHAAASYVAIEFGVRGRSISISSNCCTGLDAIQTGCEQILNGNAGIALVGGSDAPIFYSSFGGFCALGALTKRNDSPKEASRPYDRLRDGLVLSEGSATLVLEELEHALERGAPIYAEVLGYGAASEAIGMRKGDITGRVMALAIQGALQSAGLRPSDIDHVNAHGSSLPDYDVCDTNAFKEALGLHAYDIPVVSIKSMIGQPISASGGFQTAAACLAIRDQVVPPTINQTAPDPQCDLDYVPNMTRVARVKKVLMNGHSFGGSVSALIIGHAETGP
jgi:3-oxoacyl-[acyl-carrier-protein] synthase II